MSVHFPETHRRYMHYRKKDDFVVIKYGAEWCGPCKAIKPLMAELAEKYPNVYFLDVDVESPGIDDEDVPMVDHDDFKNIRSIPHFKFFVNQELVREFHGADAERLKRYVSRYSAPDLSKVKTEVQKDEDKVEDKEVENIEDELREEVQEILDEMEKALDDVLIY